MPSRILYLCLAAASFAFAQDEGELAEVKEFELEEVRERISELKQSMDRRAAERDRLSGDLQDAELVIAEKRIGLKEIERQQAYSADRKRTIEASIEEREGELQAETEQLAAQVRAAYTSGQQGRVKLLLNQQDPATVGRLLKYYEYVAAYRAANVAAVNDNLRVLADLKTEATEEEERITRLARAQLKELSDLDQAQGERRQLLASLNTQIQDEGTEMERLAAQEKDLARLIAELKSILSDYPITSEEPFSAFKGKLTWPVAGQLLHDYGQSRASGQLKWNGVVLAAPRGREVRAVYHGRVIFADWLAGMGLLVVVDHGEGYMTLYGYNETVLKSPGDWVAPGDVIATVGDSGGQSQSSLYFEVRQGTRPVNPRAWVSRQPKTG
ncbi:MAG: peptidoglycan DD-metalloendopeptidase family protein [Pseudomonadota bacterium]